MSLGITQLKAPASKKWKCSKRVEESFLKNQHMLFLSLLVEDLTSHLFGWLSLLGLCVKAHFRESKKSTSTQL